MFLTQTQYGAFTYCQRTRINKLIDKTKIIIIKQFFSRSGTKFAPFETGHIYSFCYIVLFVVFQIDTAEVGN